MKLFNFYLKYIILILFLVTGIVSTGLFLWIDQGSLDVGLIYGKF